MAMSANVNLVNPADPMSLFWCFTLPDANGFFLSFTKQFGLSMPDPSHIVKRLAQQFLVKGTLKIGQSHILPAHLERVRQYSVQFGIDLQLRG